MCTTTATSRGSTLLLGKRTGGKGRGSRIISCKRERVGGWVGGLGVLGEEEAFVGMGMKGKELGSMYGVGGLLASLSFY